MIERIFLEDLVEGIPPIKIHDVWRSVSDKEILALFEEEKQKLHLSNEQIYLLEPEDEFDTRKLTSYASKYEDCEEYRVHLHPCNGITLAERRKVIRHELYHIAAGHFTIFSWLPKPIARLLRKIYSSTLGEINAMLYANSAL